MAASVPAEQTAGATSGAVVFASEEPATKNWTRVSAPGFGGRNTEIFYLTVFNNCLYASTVNLVAGLEVCKTNGAEDPASPGQYIWTPLITGYFVDSWNQYGMIMAAYKDYLYVGTAVGVGMVVKDGKPIGARATEILRIDKNDTAELIVGAKKASEATEGDPSPRNPKSGMGAGVGSPFNVYSWRLSVYRHRLYVGAFLGKKSPLR